MVDETSTYKPTAREVARGALVDRLQRAVFEYQTIRARVAAGQYISLVEAEADLRGARDKVNQLEEDLLAFDRSFRDPP